MTATTDQSPLHVTGRVPALPRVKIALPDHPWTFLVPNRIAVVGALPFSFKSIPMIGNDAASVHEPLTLADGSLFFYYDSYAHEDPKAHARTSIPTMSTPGSLLNVVPLPDGRVFIGRSNPELSPRSIDSAEELMFDPVANSIVRINDPQAAMGQTATLLPSGKILLIGGARNIRTPFFLRVYHDTVNWLWPSTVLIEKYDVQVVPTCRVYDPTTNTFRITQPLNTPRAFHTTNLLPDGRILVSGGCVKARDDAFTKSCEIIALKDVDP